MELERLITAFNSYMVIRGRKGDLSNIDPKDISGPNAPHQYRSYSPKCTLQEKQKFDQAKQELENILNSYIDERVKKVIESMNNGSS